MSVFAGEAETSRISVNRDGYLKRMAGFWMGACIANWTGLITEMDKVKPPFYTDDNWGGADEPSIWGEPGPQDTIDFYLVPEGTAWGSDDDTDIEYLYLHLLSSLETTQLSGTQIRDGWLAHMWSDNYNKDGQNYLWVSNEQAYELMRQGIVPPDTSSPELNPHFDRIDAQLTTEIFGLLAPGRPDVALDIASLPIQVSARNLAEEAARFYVVMHSIVGATSDDFDRCKVLFEAAEKARAVLSLDGPLAQMYDFIWNDFNGNTDKDNWELTRDRVYQRFQIEGAGGYHYEQSYDAGINFAASLISLFYGQGELKRTIRIGTLIGWDCDNPTATWGGLIGFLMGIDAIQSEFPDTLLSYAYRISRTRSNFQDYTPDKDGEDTFELMAERTCDVVDQVVRERLRGELDSEDHLWVFPSN